MRIQANQGNRTGVFLVDDHPLVREALRETLQRESDLTVCGEAEDRDEALAAIAATNPGLVIVDLKLKHSNGLELVKDICDRHPRTFTLVLSMHDESSHAERAIRAGACGYVSKQEGPACIMQAVRRVLAGEIYWSQKAAAQVATRVARPAGRAGDFNVDHLSERELEVFELIGTGATTVQISSSLHIDVSTVETYRNRIKEKLHLKDSTELLQTAIRWNMAQAAA